MTLSVSSLHHCASYESCLEDLGISKKVNKVQFNERVLLHFPKHKNKIMEECDSCFYQGLATANSQEVYRK